jgi:hypothetical protein
VCEFACVRNASEREQKATARSNNWEAERFVKLMYKKWENLLCTEMNFVLFA